MTLDTSLVQRLSDTELLASTRRLVADERAVTADLLVLLGEVEARGLYLEHAFSSIFAFCTGELGFSEDAAYTRVAVARLARRLPTVVDTVRSGRVHLTGLRLLAPHLDEHNHAALLAEAAGMSKRQVEELVARIAPKPPVPAVIRKLPAPRQSALLAAPAAHGTAVIGDLRSTPVEQGAAIIGDASCTAMGSAPTPTSGLHGHPPASPAAAIGSEVTDSSADTHRFEAECTPAATPASSPRSAAHRALVQPHSGETYRVQFTASRGLRDKLREAQGLLQHQLPDGDLAAIMERAVDLLLADVKRKRFGLGRKPRAKVEEVEVREATSRHVADAIKRAVFERDGNRCAFVDERGRRCEETGGLEFDHIDGFARTRVHTVEGIRMVCRAHNQHAANTLYGREFMETARARAARLRELRSGTGPGPSPADALRNCTQSFTPEGTAGRT